MNKTELDKLIKQRDMLRKQNVMNLVGSTESIFDKWHSNKARLANSSGDSGQNEIQIYGYIVPERVRKIQLKYYDDDSFMSGGLFRTKLKELNSSDNITLRLNSGGGDVLEASVIIQAMQEAKRDGKKFNAVVDGVAASAASLIMCVCNSVLMAQMGEIMIHSAWAFAIGNSKKLAKIANNLEVADRAASKIYARKTSMRKEDIIEMMQEETFMKADEALEKGFVDDIMEDLEDEGTNMMLFDEDIMSERDEQYRLAVLASI